MDSAHTETSSGIFPEIDEFALIHTVQENPISSAVAAAAIGFVLGGGIRSRVGFALLLVGLRIAIREAMASYVASVLSTNGNGRRENRGRDPAGSPRPLSNL